MTKPSNIGFIGTGLMGLPMSKRLLEAGYDLRVWNRSPEKLAPLIELGAKASATPKALALESDIIMVCVTDTAAVESVLFDDAGVAEGGSKAKILIDFSSIAPGSTQQFAARLKNQCGMEWIDCPVSGGVPGAEQGSLIMMAGGDSQTLAGVEPVLACLSQRVTHLGAVGAGQMTKICNQMIVACSVTVIAEMMALAEKAGVDVAQLPDALKDGFADSKPFQLTAPLMASHHNEPKRWHVKTLLKDLTMAGQLAEGHQQPIPMSDLAKQLMTQHAEEGFAEEDPATLIELFSARASAEK